MALGISRWNVQLRRPQNRSSWEKLFPAEGREFILLLKTDRGRSWFSSFSIGGRRSAKVLLLLLENEETQKARIFSTHSRAVIGLQRQLQSNIRSNRELPRKTQVGIVNFVIAAIRKLDFVLQGSATFLGIENVVHHWLHSCRSKKRDRIINGFFGKVILLVSFHVVTLWNNWSIFVEHLNIKWTTKSSRKFVGPWSELWM